MKTKARDFRCMGCGKIAWSMHHVKVPGTFGMGMKNDPWYEMPMCGYGNGFYPTKCHDKAQQYKEPFSMKTQMLLLMVWHGESRKILVLGSQMDRGDIVKMVRELYEKQDGIIKTRR